MVEVHSSTVEENIEDQGGKNPLGQEEPALDRLVSPAPAALESQG